MRNLAIALLVLAFSGGSLALAVDGHEKGGKDGHKDKDKDKGKAKKELKAPADCDSLHDAMEGLGKTSKGLPKALKAKKHDKVGDALGLMMKYADRAGEMDVPDTVTNDEQKKEFGELLVAMKKVLEGAKKAADDGDGKALRGAMSKMSKACGSCHNKYRPEEDDDDHDELLHVSILPSRAE